MGYPYSITEYELGEVEKWWLLNGDRQRVLTLIAEHRALRLELEQCRQHNIRLLRYTLFEDPARGMTSPE